MAAKTNYYQYGKELNVSQEQRERLVQLELRKLLGLRVLQPFTLQEPQELLGLRVLQPFTQQEPQVLQPFILEQREPLEQQVPQARGEPLELLVLQPFTLGEALVQQELRLLQELLEHLLPATFCRLQQQG